MNEYTSRSRWELSKTLIKKALLTFLSTFVVFGVLWYICEKTGLSPRYDLNAILNNAEVYAECNGIEPQKPTLDKLQNVIVFNNGEVHKIDDFNFDSNTNKALAKSNVEGKCDIVNQAFNNIQEGKESNG